VLQTTNSRLRGRFSLSNDLSIITVFIDLFRKLDKSPRQIYRVSDFLIEEGKRYE